MKSRFLKLLLVAALALAAPLLAPVTPAHAAYGSFLCSPSPPEGAVGPKRVVNPNTNTAYQTNGQGCAFIAQADVGYFLSQGFTGGQDFFTVAITGITAATTTANSPILPAGAYIHNIIIGETAGNAVTGGVKIGTTAGGTDIASAVTVGANALVGIADASLSKRVFGTGGAPASQQIFFGCVTACNSASLNITIMYSLF